MCVHLFDVLNIEENWLSQNLSEKWISRKENLKSKKVQGIFGKKFTLALLSSAVFRLQNSVSDFF